MTFTECCSNKTIAQADINFEEALIVPKDITALQEVYYSVSVIGDSDGKSPMNVKSPANYNNEYRPPGDYIEDKPTRSLTTGIRKTLISN